MSESPSSARVFLLTREEVESKGGMDLVYWGASDVGPVRLRFTGQEGYFYVRSGEPCEVGRRQPTSLRDLQGGPVDVVRFPSRSAMRSAAERLKDRATVVFESDIRPADRALMERSITGALRVEGSSRIVCGVPEFVDPTVVEATRFDPELSVVSFDVEADGPEGPLLCVAAVSASSSQKSWERVFVHGSGPPLPGVQYFGQERDTLIAFLEFIEKVDPDVLIGWNVIEFDVAYLAARCQRHRVPFSLGRDRRPARVLKGRNPNQPSVVLMGGRVVLDGIATMRAATWTFDSWSLEFVSQTLLGRGKKIRHVHTDRLAEIQRLYREDVGALIEYNLEDCRLVRDIFAKANLIGFAMERQHLTGITLDRRAGAMIAFDNLYIPRLHRSGCVAPDVLNRSQPLASPGGFVFESDPGIYENVLVLDFKSLYPSIIRTFRIDPFGLAFPGSDPIEGFDGARFHRDEHILPQLIEELWAARDRAKAHGNRPLSHAIKIIMNSAYGVLGSPACRFYDPRLASSITRRGHEILRRSREFVQGQGRRVIYGDTDSLFVHVGEVGESDPHTIGADLARKLNGFWAEAIHKEHRVESALEVEFEVLYRRFFMPTVRGSDVGSKKRYAGLATDAHGEDELVIKGLEAVRTDWTDLARNFQRELLHRVFEGRPYESWIREVTDRLYAGALDEGLVYRKRIRRDLRDYAGSGPPHVVAARQLPTSPRIVHYVITTKGPQPVGMITASIDYEHYMQRQLAPAADSILRQLGTDFSRLGGRQLSLF